MNSATLRDPAAARDSVSLMAAQIIAGGGHVTLTGTTATDGTPESRRKLSLQRAEAVKQLLIAAGVRADLISTAGVGTDHPQHVQDLDAAGKLIAEKAMQNRAVFLEVTQ